MFLENTISLKALKKSPQKAMLLAAAFVLIGFLTSYIVFRREASVVMLFFSSLLFLPYMIKVLQKEQPTGSGGIRRVFRRHKVFMEFYLFVFIGMTLEYFLLFTVLPPEAGNIAFRNQLNTIIPGAAGNFLNVQMGLFSQILANNLIIVFTAIILSLFYEVGALFILNYNASIAGALYGSATRPLVWGLDGLAIPLYIPPIALVPHTVIELTAYIFAAIAGGILARGLSRAGQKLGTDFLLFGGLAIILVIVGAVVEVTVPFMFVGA